MIRTICCQVGCLSLPGKSIVPLLSASTSFIMSWSSDSLGFWPRDRITVPSSFVVICPNEGKRKFSDQDRMIKLSIPCLKKRADNVSVVDVPSPSLS